MLNRRALLQTGVAAGAFGLTGLRVGPVGAEGAPAGAQVSGVYHMPVGDIQVTALMDGWFSLPLRALQGVDDAAALQTLRDQFLPASTMENFTGALNAYVIRTGGKVILVDTGFGGMFDTTGRLIDNLDAAGVAPEDVDTLLLTHMHPDHIGGMLDEFGDPMFPNAEVRVSEIDQAFWTNADTMRAAPEAMQGMFAAAISRAEAYGDQMTPFMGEADVASGVTMVPLPGHTPGHSGVRVSSGDQTLLIWGDIVHAPPLQFAHPEWFIPFDVDPETAVATRQKVFDMTATDRIMVAGMHLSFPGFGHVSKETQGYGFHAAPWAYEL